MKDTKAYILETAFKLFMKKTFKEVTMKEIVQATELSKGAFYHYFESKEQLFFDVIHDYLMPNLMVDYTQFDSTSLETFYQGCLNFIDGHARGERAKRLYGEEGISNKLFNLIFEAIKFFPELKLKFNELDNNEMTAWTSVIRKAKETGEITSSMSDEDIAKVFTFSVDAIGIRRILSDKDLQFKASLASLWNGFYHQLKS